MSKKSKNRDKPESVDERIHRQVCELLNDKKLTPQFIFDILLTGHLMFKHNGLAVDQIWEAIISGFATHDRFYLTPKKTMSLFGKDTLEQEDFAYLDE